MLALGGMPVNPQTGSRNKTPGGVFLHLLKSAEEIPKEVKEKIFAEDKERRKNEKKLANDLSKALTLF